MGSYKIIVPVAGRNKVKNSSAETTGNYGVLAVGSPSQSNSPSASVSPSASASRSPSASVSPSGSTSTSPSASTSRSPSASASPSGSTSKSPSVSPSPSPSAGIATVTRITSAARFGDYAYVIQGEVDFWAGMTLATETLTAADHYVSFYAQRGSLTGIDIADSELLQVSLNGSAFFAADVIGGATGSWVRYGVAVPAAFVSGSTLYIRNPTANARAIDGIQVEEGDEPTTYIDGDQGPLYRWTGLRHASASTRDAQERGGGYIRDFYDDYAVNVTDGTTRIGMPPLAHNLQGQALQPGAVYQSTKVLPREIALEFQYTVDDAGTEALTWAAFHAKRKQLIDLLKPDAVRGAQPVVIGYAGANSAKILYAAFYYSGGLDTFGDLLHVDAKQPVRMLAPDPYWYEDNRETATLDFTDTLTNSDYIQGRISGRWQALGSTAPNGQVYAVLADPARGRVYFGGTFSTANGVVVNQVCYWDGSTFVAMDSGVNNNVRTLALAPNGDVWVGGEFTAVGSAAAATKGLARWNLSTGTWTAFNESTSTFTHIFSVVVSPSNVVYVAGNFTNWEGDAANDFIASTSDNGTNWDALGTVPFSATLLPGADNCMVIGPDGYLYVGAFNNGGGAGAAASVHKWDGSSWTTLLSTNTGATAAVYTLLFARDGTLYIGGSFSTLGGVTASNIAKYNGSAVSALGAGANDNVYIIAEQADGLIVVGGQFTSAGGSTLGANLAYWNGTTWAPADISNLSTVFGLGALGSDFYIGHQGTSDPTAAGITTVSLGASATLYPSATLIGPTSASCVLRWLENQSTGERQYYNLTVQAGETVTFELDPTIFGVTSDWRGVLVTQPLSNSDDLRLLPGDNTIAAFITGTTTGVSFLLHWQPRHWGTDGAA